MLVVSRENFLLYVVRNFLYRIESWKKYKRFFVIIGYKKIEEMDMKYARRKDCKDSKDSKDWMLVVNRENLDIVRRMRRLLIGLNILNFRIESWKKFLTILKYWIFVTGRENLDILNLDI